MISGSAASSMAAVGATPEDRLAERLLARPSGWRALARTMRGLGEVDRALYQAVAATPSPTLDGPLRRLSQLADHSKLWVGIASVLVVAGGRRSRRAALAGVASIAVTSAVVNLPMKLAGRRRRPDRTGAGVPTGRWVDMPGSSSFPSGHAASGAAFATAVGDALPMLGAPLRLLAGAVAFSRVHTGVHYPGDIVIGTLIGHVLGDVVASVARGMGEERPRRIDQT